MTWEKCFYKSICSSSWILYCSTIPWCCSYLVGDNSLMHLSSQFRQKALMNLGCIRTSQFWSYPLLNHSPIGQFILNNCMSFLWPSVHLSFFLAAVLPLLVFCSETSTVSHIEAGSVFPASLAARLCSYHNHAVSQSSLYSVD